LEFAQEKGKENHQNINNDEDNLTQERVANARKQNAYSSGLGVGK